MDVLEAMIRHAASLSRSVELTAQWGEIVAVGRLYPIVCDVRHRLSDFIHAIVVHRRDEAIRGWRNWIREDPPGAPVQVASSRLGSSCSISSMRAPSYTWWLWGAC